MDNELESLINKVMELKPVGDNFSMTCYGDGHWQVCISPIRYFNEFKSDATTLQNALIAIIELMEKANGN